MLLFVVCLCLFCSAYWYCALIFVVCLIYDIWCFCLIFFTCLVCCLLFDIVCVAVLWLFLLVYLLGVWYLLFSAAADCVLCLIFRLGFGFLIVGLCSVSLWLCLLVWCSGGCFDLIV